MSKRVMLTFALTLVLSMGSWRVLSRRWVLLCVLRMAVCVRVCETARRKLTESLLGGISASDV
jgi:hypothetical protein